MISQEDFDYINEHHNRFELNLLDHEDAPLLRTIRINQTLKKERILAKAIEDLKKAYRFAEEEGLENKDIDDFYQ